MATVIDALVVELGLDPSKFTKGQDESIDSLRKFEERAKKAGGNVERSAGDMTEAFSLLQNKLLGIAALFFGGMGIEQFAQHMTKLTAGTGYLSQQLGVSAQELSRWEYAGKRVGATAQDIDAAFKSITSNRTEFQVTGNSQLASFAYSTAATSTPLKIFENGMSGAWLSNSQILMNLSKWATSQKDKALASHLLETRAGLLPGAINLLMQGPEKLKEWLKETKELAPSDADIRKLQELQKTWSSLTATVEAFSRSLLVKLAPAIEGVMKKIQEWFDFYRQNTDPKKAEENAEKLHEGLRDKFGTPSGPFKTLQDWLNPGGVGEKNGSGGTATFDERFTGQQPTTKSLGSGPSGENQPAPAHILEKAKEVALSGGPGAVQAFMAQQGYPRSGNWCGEFAAAVVRGAGGTPPKGAAIASNWRNWGSPVKDPQPGDIAVRRGVPTGSTGSHVTFVESYDPKTGTFVGLGGNQGRWQSRYPASRFDFRRSSPEEDQKMKGSWFGQYQGKYKWSDPQSGSKTASGIGLDVPGIALPNRATLGKYFEVTTPDGRKFVLRQTDVGPAKWTGRGVDFTASAAEKMGYQPGNFPTDKMFSVRSLSPDAWGAGAQPVPWLSSPGAISAATHYNTNATHNSSQTSIGNIEIHAPNSDAAGIATALDQNLRRFTTITNSNNGPQ